MQKNIKNVILAINYIENHLTEQINLIDIASAVHYSKYHLHHMFTDTVGLTIHNYVQRRRLTEAAKLLVFSDKSILEIAMIARYDSQQSFTDAFKTMYKKSPNRYRKNKEFYPLQLRYILNENPTNLDRETKWQQNITFAKGDDIPKLMNLVRLVVDGFPYLDEKKYLKKLKEYINYNQALILKDVDIAIGIIAFNIKTGGIDFLGVHPQYKKYCIAKALLKKVLNEFAQLATHITVTTFREGDKADTGYRNTFKKLGFAEAELLVEFGYPTQRFVLKKRGLEDIDCE